MLDFLEEAELQMVKVMVHEKLDKVDGENNAKIAHMKQVLEEV